MFSRVRSMVKGAAWLLRGSGLRERVRQLEESIASRGHVQHLQAQVTAVQATLEKIHSSLPIVLPNHELNSRRKLNPAAQKRLVELIAKINEGERYHRIDLGDGLVIRGNYNMKRYVPYYGIPEDLTGLSVLDVGTSSRFFAFECARRGAKVTAIDIWSPDACLDEVADLLGLEVRYVQKSIHDLDPSFGQFDLVICGSLLLHLRDIYGAVEKIRAVCRGLAIVTTAAMDDPECEHRACCEFIGATVKSGNGAYSTYWRVNAAGLRQMLLSAGFSHVNEPVRFTLTTELGIRNCATPQVLLKAAA